MGFEMLCKLVDSIVENEFNNSICDKDFTEGIYGDEYKRYSEKIDQIWKEIISVIPEDKLYLIKKYTDTITEQLIIEEKQMFRSGVGRGLNQLKYLNDYNLGTLLNEM